jgi:hypothetical protein
VRAAAMIIARIIHGVTAHIIVRIHEWILGACFLAMGVRLFFVAETQFHQASVMAALGRILPPACWAYILAIVGGLRLAALLLNGTFQAFQKISPLARSVLAFISAIIWCSFADALFNFPTGIVAVVFVALALEESWWCIIIAGEAGRAFPQGCHDAR